MSAASIARPAAALLRRHGSLLLMGVGVGAQLLATVYFYQRLSPADYAQLAVVLTFIGLVAAFGLLGAEQLMLRLASTDGRATLSLPLNAYRLLYWALLLGPILLSACALAVWGLALHWAYPLALLGAGLMLVFNGLRLLSRFALAQFINNSWRYSLLLLLGLSYLGWP
ncbi:MAG: hypothetical protein OIF38_05485, partial [Cellvibrionaceae bacterium]|nr:hypothetical protein [Cellvibrionaceae bacterium]